MIMLGWCHNGTAEIAPDEPRTNNLSSDLLASNNNGQDAEPHRIGWPKKARGSEQKLASGIISASSTRTVEGGAEKKGVPTSWSRWVKHIRAPQERALLFNCHGGGGGRFAASSFFVLSSCPERKAFAPPPVIIERVTPHPHVREEK